MNLLLEVCKKFKNKNEPRVVKRFDSKYATIMFNRYKDDLRLGAVFIPEDNNIYEIVVEDGAATRTYGARGFSIDGVEETSWGTPCIHLIFKGGNEEVITCYYNIVRNEVGKFIKADIGRYTKLSELELNRLRENGNIIINKFKEALDRKEEM